MDMTIDESGQYFPAGRIDREIGMSRWERLADIDDPVFRDRDMSLADEFHGLGVEKISVQDMNDHLSTIAPGSLDSARMRE